MHFLIPPPGYSFHNSSQLILHSLSVNVNGFLGGSVGKDSAFNEETQVRSLGWEDPLEKGMETYSSILAWRIPWTEESGGLQSMGSQRVRHD